MRLILEQNQRKKKTRKAQDGGFKFRNAKEKKKQRDKGAGFALVGMIIQQIWCTRKAHKYISSMLQI